MRDLKHSEALRMMRIRLEAVMLLLSELEDDLSLDSQPADACDRCGDGTVVLHEVGGGLFCGACDSSCRWESNNHMWCVVHRSPRPMGAPECDAALSPDSASVVTQAPMTTPFVLDEQYVCYVCGDNCWSFAPGGRTCRTCYPGYVPKHEAARPRVSPDDASDDGEDGLLYEAWGIIANAFGGNWDQADDTWRTAAERFRDKFHSAIRVDMRVSPDFHSDVLADGAAPNGGAEAAAVQQSGAVAPVMPDTAPSADIPSGAYSVFRPAVVRGVLAGIDSFYGDGIDQASREELALKVLSETVLALGPGRSDDTTSAETMRRVYNAAQRIKSALDTAADDNMHRVLVNCISETELIKALTSGRASGDPS